MIINIKRPSIREMIRVVKEREKEGFECVAPIRKIQTSRKNFKYDQKLKDFHQFERVEEREFYFVKMRKVDES
jgi:hypothetical protein